MMDPSIGVWGILLGIGRLACGLTRRRLSAATRSNTPFFHYQNQ